MAADARVRIDVARAPPGEPRLVDARVSVVIDGACATLEPPFTVGMELRSYGGDEELHALEATLLALDGAAAAPGTWVLRTVHRVTAMHGSSETMAHHRLEAGGALVPMPSPPAAGRVVASARASGPAPSDPK